MGELRELSLFSGYGGLSLGLRLANLKVRTVAYVEWDKYPQEIIKARIKDGFLDDAPIWGDISTLDGEQFRGVVDIITGGFPCPPFSVAGLGRGSDDKRNLWPETLRVIREVRPSIVILENVPGILTASRKRGTPSYGAIVVGQLAEEGFIVRWETIGASDVGAPHRRKRWFCIGVAYSNGTGPGGETRDNYTIGAFSREGSEPRLDQRGSELANSSIEGLEGRYRDDEDEGWAVREGIGHDRDGVRSDTGRSGGQLAYPQSERHRGRSGSQRGDEGRLVQSEEQGRSEVGSAAEGRNGELAYTEGRKSWEQKGWDRGQGSQRGSPELAYTKGECCKRSKPEGDSRGQPQEEVGNRSRDAELADTNSQRGCGRATHWQDAEDVGQPPETQGRNGNHPIWPPRPDNIEGWIAVLNERPDLAPALTKDALATICGVADGPTRRVDRLKALGNGVVPGVLAEFLARVGITSERGCIK